MPRSASRAVGAACLELGAILDSAVVAAAGAVFIAGALLARERWVHGYRTLVAGGFIALLALMKFPRGRLGVVRCRHGRESVGVERAGEPSRRQLVGITAR